MAHRRRIVLNVDLFHAGVLGCLRRLRCLEVHLWALSRADAKGYVHRGQPMQAERVALSVGLSLSVYWRQLRAWRQHDLGQSWRSSRGLVLRVLRDLPDVTNQDRERVAGSGQSEIAQTGPITPSNDLPELANPGAAASLQVLTTPRIRSSPKDLVRTPGGNGDCGLISEPNRRESEMRVLRRFDELHARCFEGARYLAAFKKDRMLLRGALKCYGEARVLEMVQAFFSEIDRYRKGAPDCYIGKAKPDVGGFVRQIPNLLAAFEWETEVTA